MDAHAVVDVKYSRGQQINLRALSAVRKQRQQVEDADGALTRIRSAWQRHPYRRLQNTWTPIQ